MKIHRRSILCGSLLLAFVPLAAATTFVVRENGVEVGRYDHDDGSSETRFLDQTLEPAKSQQPDLKEPAPPMPPDSQGDPANSMFIKFYAIVVAVSCGAAYLAWVNHNRGHQP